MARDVRVAILGDSRDFQRAVNAADRDVDQFDRSMGRMQTAANRAGPAIATALAVGATAVAGLAISSIQAASDWDEALSRSNTVFGRSADEIEAWAETASSSFGQSKTEAISAAGSFGNMFTQLGVGEETAADMSMTMTELASDFASFHNADISDVLTAQEAAFRGEYDALQRFVPTINAATVEQKALEMGLADVNGELDQQDKALATYQLMMEGAGDAMGDFDRTSGSLANQQRELSAKFEDLRIELGEKLLPIATSIARFILDTLIPAFEEHSTEVGIAAAIIGGALVAAFTAWAISAASAAVATIAATWPILAIIAALALLVAGIIYAYTEWDWFRNAVDSVADAGLWLWNNVLKPVASWITGTLIPTIGRVATSFINFGRDVGNVALTIWGHIDGIIRLVADMPRRISNATLGLFDGFKDAFRGAINWIIRKWNDLSFTLPSISFMGVTVGGQTFSTPDIQTLHSGGVFRAPSGMDEGLALLKDGERVLSPSQSRNSGGLSGPAVFVLQVGEREFGRIAIDAIETLGRSNGVRFA